MTTREKIEVMEAYDRGEEIEYTAINGGFICSDLCTDDFDFIVSNYRIKPKEKKMVTVVYEYIYFDDSYSMWMTSGRLYRNDDDFISNNKRIKVFKKTDREFKVEEY